MKEIECNVGNQTTYKNPFKIALGTYGVVLFGSWFYCRYNYHKQRIQMAKLKPMVSQ